MVTVLVSTSSTLWTTVLCLSQSVYAMGRDGLLPPLVGRLDRRSEPLAALVLAALGGIALLVALAATVALEDRMLQWYAAGGIILGVPFAVWGAWILNKRGSTPIPESTAATAPQRRLY